MVRRAAIYFSLHWQPLVMALSQIAGPWNSTTSPPQVLARSITAAALLSSTPPPQTLAPSLTTAGQLPARCFSVATQRRLTLPLQTMVLHSAAAWADKWFLTAPLLPLLQHLTPTAGRTEAAAA